MKIQFSIKMNVGSKAAIVTIIFSQYHLFLLYVLNTSIIIIYNKMAQRQDISQENKSL